MNYSSKLYASIKGVFSRVSKGKLGEKCATVIELVQ